MVSATTTQGLWKPNEATVVACMHCQCSSLGQLFHLWSLPPLDGNHSDPTLTLQIFDFYI